MGPGGCEVEVRGCTLSMLIKAGEEDYTIVDFDSPQLQGKNRRERGKKRGQGGKPLSKEILQTRSLRSYARGGRWKSSGKKGKRGEKKGVCRAERRGSKPMGTATELCASLKTYFPKSVGRTGSKYSERNALFPEEKKESRKRGRAIGRTISLPAWKIFSGAGGKSRKTKRKT